LPALRHKTHIRRPKPLRNADHLRDGSHFKINMRTDTGHKPFHIRILYVAAILAQM
jgi:hypothetical protein